MKLKPNFRISLFLWNKKHFLLLLLLFGVTSNREFWMWKKKETMAESEIATATKPRVRRFVRVGIFLISHSNYVRYTLLLNLSFCLCFAEFEFQSDCTMNNRVAFFSFIGFVSGIVALLLLPMLAKNTYISENALMPGYTLSLYFSKSLFFKFLLGTVWFKLLN